MHSFLVQSAKYEAQSNPDTLIISGDSSIGIEEVRQIQNFLSRKPLGDKNTIYILDAHQLTLSAQNAILKTLEEPPSNSEIYLVTSQPDLLLPTILSRVQIEKSTNNKPDYSLEKISDNKKLIEKIKAAKVGERVALVDELSLTRETALELLDQFEQTLHTDLNLKLNYDLIVETRKYLKTNVNVKLAIDNLFFGIISV